MYQAALKFVSAHKIIAGILLLLLAGGGYFIYKKLTGSSSVTRYILATAKKGTVVTSVSASGQVSASTQVDIKAKVSGDVLGLRVESGAFVTAGTLLLFLDARDAEKAVRDAETNLQSAKLSLEKLKKPADTLSLLQAQNALASAKDSKEKAEADYKKYFDDGFNTVSNAFFDLPTTITGLHDMLFNADPSIGSGYQWNVNYYADAVKDYDANVLTYRDEAIKNYENARSAYDANFSEYKTLSRYSEEAQIEHIVGETYETAKKMAEAIKSANNLVQFYKDKLGEKNIKPQAIADTHITLLTSYTTKINTHLQNLLSIEDTIRNSRDASAGSARSVAEKEEALIKLKAGAEPLDIQSEELAVTQRENALFDAKEKLADYYIRAPFDGVAAKLNVKAGDSVSSNTVVGTLITRQKIAEVSLNEVDVAKVRVGEKATLTFDAVPDLSITGQVAEVDTIGTASQGVVSYTVKITFDTQDERVKTGMSVSANIIIDAKADVLIVPNAAVKSQGGMHFVEAPDSREKIQAADSGSSGIALSYPTRRISVEVGVSNDEVIEISSGLAEGDTMIANTIKPQSVTSQQSSPSFRIPGLPGSGGGGGSGGLRR